jgi:hypothetical protein
MIETNQTLQNFFGTLNGVNEPATKQNVYLNGASGSPFQMGGCQGCHGTQGQSVGGDMSVIVSRAPITSNTGPDTIDGDDATLAALAATRLYDPLPSLDEDVPPTKHRVHHHHRHHAPTPPGRDPE